MGDTSDEILRNYMENVLRLQRERDRGVLSDHDLKQIALESGMSDADLEYVHQRFDDYMNRGQGFIKYKNWGDAIEELEQATALAPYSVDALNALATAYAGRWREKGVEADREQASRIAERALELDSSNDAALRMVSALRTQREELLGQETKGNSSGGVRRAFIGVVGILVVIGVIALVTSGSNEEAPSVSAPSAVSAAPAPAPEPPEPPVQPEAPVEPPALAREVLTFGVEGVGPGQLTDARSIAVDGAEHVYVAEYSSGRIQAFDAKGEYLRQWNVGENHYVTGMAADHDGHVYVVHTGRIYRYDGNTGELMGEVKYSGGPGFRSVAVMADGGLAAAWDGHWKGGLFINPKSKDNLVIFDKNLRPVKTIKNVISSVSGGVVFSPEVAVDGLGNIYMAGERGNAIYHFNPQGKFVDKFGGTLHGAQGIAVDGRRRVYVTGFGGVQVFDSNGGAIGTIDIRGSADNVAISEKNELYVVARTKVMKMVMSQ
jgi:tetratricopeptide (TPR) repeat protein